MALVLLLSADLLFGSRVQGALSLAGHRVETVADGTRLRERLGDREAQAPEVLVIDLTDERLGGPELVAGLSSEGSLGAVRTLGFYSHVELATREAAEAAGFDLVVPRSRMAREGAEIVTRLASG